MVSTPSDSPLDGVLADTPSLTRPYRPPPKRRKVSMFCTAGHTGLRRDGGGGMEASPWTRQPLRPTPWGRGDQGVEPHALGLPVPLPGAWPRAPPPWRWTTLPGTSALWPGVAAPDTSPPLREGVVSLAAILPGCDVANATWNGTAPGSGRANSFRFWSQKGGQVILLPK